MKRTNEQIRRLADKRTKKRTNIKTNKKIYWFLSFFVSLSFVSLLVFGLAWWFSGWNGKDPLNVVVSSGENLWVLSLRPGEKQAVSILIPPTAAIEVPGRGKWQARALWEISQLENDPSLVSAAGWNLLEVPIDQTLRLQNWKGRQTSWWDLPRNFKIIKFLKSLDQTQIKDIDLSSISISRRVVDPGGAELVEVNPDLLSPRVEEWFRLDSLRREGLTVAVRNNSSRAGAGALLSRQLEHVGLRVVSVADGGGENRLLIKNKTLRQSLTVRKLSSWLNAKPAVADFPDRADILIVVK